MSKPYMKLRVLLADDHQMVREGLQTMMGREEEIEIIGEAANGEELIQKTRTLQPDVILVDVKMPKCNGVDATKIIKKEFPHIGIVAISSFDEENLILDMLNAGAKSYLMKNASKQDILAAIQAVYRDETYYSNDVNIKLAQYIGKGGHYVECQKVKDKFTPRELEIIAMICESLSSKQIADLLKLRPRTIERYRDDIMEKMEVKNAAGLVIFAVRHGLYDPAAPARWPQDN